MRSRARRRLLTLLAGTPLIQKISMAQAQEKPDGLPRSEQADRVRRLADAYFDALLDLDPLWASELGLASDDQAGRLVVEIAPSHRRMAQGVHARTMEQLRDIDATTLDADTAVLLGLTRWIAQDHLARLEHPDHLLPLDHQGFSVPFRMANALVGGLSPFRTAADFERHIERLRQLPAWCSQAIVNADEGLRHGIVHARPVLARLAPLLRDLAQGGRQSPYLAPLSAMPEGLQDKAGRALVERYRDVVDREVVPALRRLSDAFETRIVPKARASSGWSGLPGGQAWYAQWVRSHTTTELSAQDIHDIGLREVAQVAHRLRALQRRFGHEGDVRAFLQWHEQRPQSRPFRSEADVLDAYRRLNDKVSEALPGLFNRLPRARLEVWPEPELTKATAGEHYAAPSADGARPGVFFAPVPDATRYLARGMTTLFLHEAVPGHHLQVALAQELPLSRLQQHYFHTAFGEGWALYAETLGYELGLYGDPEAELGHLVMAMVRAVRLVVDTGIHAMGWSYDQAVQYFAVQTGYGERAAQLQIERYMAQPGQALAYAIGRMRLERLRDRQRASASERFSLARFHDFALQSGALPLPVLELSSPSSA